MPPRRPAEWSAVGGVRILEPRAAGHRLWYVRLVADAAPGRCTLVTTADGAASTEYEQHLGSGPLATEVSELPAADAGDWFRDVLVREAGGRQVLVPDAEAALWPLLTARIDQSMTVTAVLMRMNRGVGTRGVAAYAAKLALAGALRLRWRSRLRLLALVAPGSRSSLPLRLVGIRLLHDPVRFQPAETDPAAARRHLGLPAAPPIFAVVGPLSSRKCVPELVEAWTAAGMSGLLLLAGSAAPEVREAVRQAGPVERSGVVLRDEYLSDRHFDTYLAASDVAVLLYRNRGSSGVLGKALAADCDVITSTTTPPAPTGRGGRVVRIERLTVDRIRAALLAWPGRRGRHPRGVDETSDFAGILLGLRP
jgi:glycosyltransferase involved in cell wall biosynthesis